MGSSSSPSTAEHAKSRRERSVPTPGPWTAECDVIEDNGPWSVFGQGDRLVASVEWWDNAEANARLIAVAPEMYEALSEIGLLILRNRTAPLEEIVAICARVLDKAEGRS